TDHNLEFIESPRQISQVELENKLIQSPKKPTHLASSAGLLIPLVAPLNLLICGASPDVEPVTSLANQLGWKTTVIDHRKEFARCQLFPAANNVLHIKRSEWKSFELVQFDAAIIMSHQFERDQDYLARIINSQINYIGLLGPRKRRNKLLSEIGAEFSQLEGRVFGPIGLDIGADTPETIALAIIAEIQAVKSNKKVGFCYQDETR
ncbi:MAG: XdhC family protein, partial [Kangiellaceae bacterium]|nr:XdhC family protein [Kangiellaceae bacterium]